MYMIILPKDFFQNSLINGFGVQSVLMLSICLAGYLVILQPVLSSVLWSASLLGVLGLTSQLCFLRDVLSMMTLHIYCFYVYAARIYQFQVYALSAFWRLFRGKKWNMLRQRLDSVRYNVDQLFLGTLLFTILLFTLPTFALYYVVFTLLRLIVLTAHQAIHTIVQTIDTFPLFSVVMWCLNFRQMTGNFANWCTVLNFFAKSKTSSY